MTNEKLVTLLTAANLQERLRVAFHKAGIATVETLQDQDRVKIASDFVYESLPLTARIAIKATMGRDGFDRSTIELCRLLAKTGSIDFNKIDRLALHTHLTRFFNEANAR